MTNVINNYETIFVIDASLQEEQINAISEKFQAMIALTVKLNPLTYGAKDALLTLLTTKQKVIMFWLISQARQNLSQSSSVFITSPMAYSEQS